MRHAARHQISRSSNLSRRPLVFAAAITLAMSVFAAIPSTQQASVRLNRLIEQFGQGRPAFGSVIPDRHWRPPRRSPGRTWTGHSSTWSMARWTFFSLAGGGLSASTDAALRAGRTAEE
jgi:hypothetical protein